MEKKKLTVQGLTITIEQIKEDDYISLTDIAKINADEPAYVIQNWMKNNNTIRYLYLWEQIHNPAINPIHLDDLLKLPTTTAESFLRKCGSMNSTPSG